jgi:hypothetical protein
MEFPSDEAIDELDFASSDKAGEVQEKHQPADEMQGKTVPEPEEDLDVSEPTATETLAAESADITGDLLENELKREPEVTKSPSGTTTTESPEDYLVPDEDGPDHAMKSDSLPPPAAPDTPPAAEAETTRPSVVTEPPEATDFSRQIEGLTQEWSKKMLVSTYASMDKLIQALGEMAPTIVEQVAREIIPPLAEKIIKAEIKRLEEKIEDEHT